MIQLFDLSATFWRNYFGSLSALTAFSETQEKIDFYWRSNTRLVVCADSPTNHRKAEDPTYKANRKPMPSDGVESLKAVEDWVRRNGIPFAMCDGFEADDVIATLAGQGGLEEVQILGDEKDYYCLISPTVSLWGRKGRIGYAECVMKWDVPPENMTDFLALVGDAADNVKGCPGIGPTKAATLLKKFGSINQIKRASGDELLGLDKFGPSTAEAVLQWDPAPALAMVRLRTAPVNIVDLLGET